MGASPTDGERVVGAAQSRFQESQAQLHLGANLRDVVARAPTDDPLVSRAEKDS
jgi:hypothetical protein